MYHQKPPRSRQWWTQNGLKSWLLHLTHCGSRFSLLAEEGVGVWTSSGLHLKTVDNNDPPTTTIHLYECHLADWRASGNNINHSHNNNDQSLLRKVYCEWTSSGRTKPNLRKMFTAIRKVSQVDVTGCVHSSQNNDHGRNNWITLIQRRVAIWGWLLRCKLSEMVSQQLTQDKKG